MSRSADPRRRDAGFALIEVIVAIGLFAVVATAVLPVFVTGLSSTGKARQVTQAKGVAQGQLERMRNLPYHVAWDSGDYRDVLDYYYRDVAPAGTPTCKTGTRYASPQDSWKGYVAADDDRRCDYEPQTGAMYRSVTVGTDGFAVVVDTQFLSDATPPTVLAPGADYTTHGTTASGHDTPVSSQIGVVVTVLYSDRGVLHPVSTYTRIADQPDAPQQLRAAADATSFDVGSVTPSNAAVSLDAGLLHLSGSLTYASTADLTLASTSAGAASGTPGGGAAATLAVPPATTGSSSSTQPAGSLDGTCGTACWGGTRVELGPASSQDGLPNLGSVLSPMQALLTDTLNSGLAFDNGPVAARRADLALDPAAPLARLAADAVAGASGVSSTCAAGGGTPAYVAASGFLRTTSAKDATSPYVVEACARTRAGAVSLFPTTFAPEGVIQVRLESAAARCLVSGATHVPTTGFSYEAAVRYHVPGGPGTYSGWIAVSSTDASTTDPLDAIPLTTDVGGDLTLGHFVDSWSALRVAEVEVRSAGRSVSVEVPGVVTILTQPTRTGTIALEGRPEVLVDPSSAVSLTLGAVSCSTQDAR